MRIQRLSLLAFSIISSVAASHAVASAFGPDVPEACLAGLRDGADIPGEPVARAWGSLSILRREATDIPSFGVGTRGAAYTVRRIACGGDHAALVVTIDDRFAYTYGPEFLFPKFHAERAGVRHDLHAIRLSGERVVEGSPGHIERLLNHFVLVADGSGDSLTEAFDLVIEDSVLQGASVYAPIPAYLPTPQTYPDAFGARPINGRYAGNFFDPAKPGEGIVVEIGDVPGQDDTHFLQFAWHSFDNNGAPFWISGGETFHGRPKRLHMPAAYRSGGRFGGARPADAQVAWGSVDIEFSDCRTAVIDYSANPGLPASVPAGAGHLQWQRLTGISGYSCD